MTTSELRELASKAQSMTGLPDTNHRTPSDDRRQVRRLALLVAQLAKHLAEKE